MTFDRFKIILKGNSLLGCLFLFSALIQASLYSVVK